VDKDVNPFSDRIIDDPAIDPQPGGGLDCSFLVTIDGAPWLVAEMRSAHAGCPNLLGRLTLRHEWQ
jgi:hypothetical protein